MECFCILVFKENCITSPLMWAIPGFRMLWLRMPGVFNAGRDPSFSSLSLALFEQFLPSPPSMSLICPCVTVQLQCASLFLWEVSLGFQHVGEGFWLAPHLSAAYLNQAHTCHPSHGPPISLSAVTSSKISLIHLAQPSITLSVKQRHISQSVTQMMTDRKLSELLCYSSHFQIFWKMNPDKVGGHSFVVEIKVLQVRFLRLMREKLFL